MCAQAVFGNMQIQNEQFIFPERTEGIDETDLTFADGFDFRSGKLDAGRVFLQQEVLEVSLLVFNADGFRERAHNGAKVGKKWKGGKVEKWKTDRKSEVLNTLPPFHPSTFPLKSKFSTHHKMDPGLGEKAIIHAIGSFGIVPVNPGIGLIFCIEQIIDFQAETEFLQRFDFKFI